MTITNKYIMDKEYMLDFCKSKRKVKLITEKWAKVLHRHFTERQHIWPVITGRDA